MRGVTRLLDVQRSVRLRAGFPKLDQNPSHLELDSSETGRHRGRASPVSSTRATVPSPTYQPTRVIGVQVPVRAFGSGGPRSSLTLSMRRCLSSGSWIFERLFSM